MKHLARFVLAFTTLLLLTTLSAHAQILASKPAGPKPTVSSEMVAKALASTPITVELRVPANKVGQSRAQLAKSADALRQALLAHGTNVGSVRLVNGATGTEISVVTAAEMTAASATQ